MASMYEDTNPHLLRTLLEQIHTRESALPDFQRDFVWEPSATQELIVSIASNYPAGSLLRIRNTHRLFASRQFEGAPALNGHAPTYLVLDGQQRLTSLYQAFYGVGEHRFFVRVRDLIEGRDFEDCIFHERANRSRTRNLAKPEVQVRELIMPLDVLQEGTNGFSKWGRRVRHSVGSQEVRDQLEEAFDEIEKRWIQPIHEYLFPVVTLSDATGADAVCTIFETLNRTGVKLSVFELLTARFWPQNIRLRDLWASALEQHPVIGDFAIDPYYALQIIALASRAAPSAKRSDVLDLTPTDITGWWDRAVRGLAKAVEILRDDCGVIVPAWLPYNTIVNPLAAVLARVGLPAGPAAAAHVSKLRQWFWCSVFGQAYESSPTSQSAKDTTELARWLAGGEAPDTVRLFRFDPRLLREAGPKQRAIYRGTIALVLSHGPRDFHTGEKLTGKLIVERSVDDHHIFPQAYLTRRQVPERLRNCVLNRTLIDRQTNLRISDHPPATYMKDILDQLQPQMFQELLTSHLLPASPDSPLWHDDFDTFLDWRQEAIWQAIQQVTGAVEAADLLSDEVPA
jgi:hypothetical protein